MSSGQSFQDQNAAFEHMYSPSKAKKLFKQHRDIEERFERDMVRLRWETKTTTNELSKSKSIFEKRGVVLYKKLRDIEDKFFQKITAAADQSGDDSDDDIDDEPIDIRPPTRQSNRRRTAVVKPNLRPNTTLGILHQSRTSVSSVDEPHRSKSDLGTNNVMTHSTTFIDNDVKPSNLRSSSALNRSRSDVGSETHSNSSKKPRNLTSATVHFNIPTDNVEKSRGSTPSIQRPPYMERKSSILFRRSRRQSVFALTKAKQFELRNTRFKEENEDFQEELNEKIQDFYVRIDEYKEQYRKSLEPKSNELPEIKDKDITNTDDISGDKYSSKYFMKKLKNPFAEKSKYMKTPSMEQLDTSLHPQSPRSDVSHQLNLPSPKSEHQGKEATANTQRATPQPPNSARGSEHPSCLTREAVQKTLSITSRPTLVGEDVSEQQLMKERVKLLYLDAHGALENVPENKPKPKVVVTPAKKSELHLDLKKIREAYDDYMLSGKTHDDMMKLVSVAAKLKHNVRKKRDKSFVPFIAVRKAVMTWKNIASRSRERLANQSSESIIDNTTE